MMKTDNHQYIVYSDTDSIYVTLEKLVEKHFPNQDTMKTVAFVDRICKDAIQPQINRLFRLLTDRYLNGVGEYLLMNREVIGDKGIWTAKKRYLINVRDKEGIRKEKAELKYMGVEIAKSSIPKFCRDAMKEAVTIVMEKDQQTLFNFVAETKAKFQQQPIEAVSFPRGVNGLAKYGHHQTVYIKGTPFHTKGALMYNHMLDQTGLSNKYPKIKDGEKMKFFYLREPNQLGVNAMAFLTKFPPEFAIDDLIDWETQWEKSMIEPLQLILRAIGWDTQRRANLDDLFDWSGDEEKIPADTDYNKYCKICGKLTATKESNVWFGCGHEETDHEDEDDEGDSDLD
jgi:DNA polymerase elongation subunit (family B)